MVSICIYLMASDPEQFFFMHLLTICISSLENVYSYPCPFLVLLSLLNSLCIWDINPLSGEYLANIFFHYVGFSLHFVVSFGVQKLVSLM